MAERDEMVDREGRALLLIDRGGEERRVVIRFDDEDGDAHRRLAQGGDRRGARGDDAEGIDPLTREIVDRLLRTDLVVVTGRDRADRVSGTAGGRLDRTQNARRAELDGALHEHADPLGPVGREGAGGHVRPVAQLLDHVEHAAPGRLPDVGVVVEHARHGHVRDARDGRDLPDVRLRRARVGHVAPAHGASLSRGRRRIPCGSFPVSATPGHAVPRAAGRAPADPQVVNFVRRSPRRKLVRGDVSERPKVRHSKCRVGRPPTVGSNPTVTAIRNPPRSLLLTGIAGDLLLPGATVLSRRSTLGGWRGIDAAAGEALRYQHLSH